MADIYHVRAKTFQADYERLTVCSGPVILSSDNTKVLVHIWDDSQKYQFVWGRLDTQLSLVENALKCADEILPKENIEITDDEPLSIIWEIKRHGHKEAIVLFHFPAHLTDESQIGTAEWKTLGELESLVADDMLASSNVIIAAEHFMVR